MSTTKMVGKINIRDVFDAAGFLVLLVSAWFAADALGIIAEALKA